MSTVTVYASRVYEVQIEKTLPADAGERVRAAVPGALRAALLADDRVWALYGPAVEERLAASGLRVFHRTFPRGEASKNGQTYLETLEWLSASGLTRQDALVALGGGVVGDLGGFAAATYMRGIPYVQFPTTLLSMVDSSVGGKTAVDLPAGKNLAGAFWQPSLVLCACSALDTLPEETLASGCAEVVKYGVLCDVPLFRHLEDRGLDFDRPWVVERSVADKQDYVNKDEFDRGARKFLNLGHTLGHALEQKSGYALSHGEAVSVGMAVFCRAAARTGRCSPELPERLEALLRKLGLPTEAPWPPEDLLPLMMGDKKRSGDRVEVILPQDLGKCVVLPMNSRELLDFVKEGYRPCVR